MSPQGAVIALPDIAPAYIIEGTGSPDTWHETQPGDPNTALCGEDLTGCVEGSVPPGDYLCRTCLKLNGGPF